MRRSSAQNSVTEVLLCDTGVLLAAGNVKDEHHHACVKLLRQADGPLLVPAPVMGEIGYLLETRVGAPGGGVFPEVLRRRRLPHRSAGERGHPPPERAR
jgi:predicted nucleic acid-binding protein